MGTNSAPLLADLFLKAPSITTWCRKPKTNLVCQSRQRPSSLATRSGISTVYIVQRWQRGLCWKLHQGYLPVGIWNLTDSSTSSTESVLYWCKLRIKRVTTHLSMLGIYYKWTYKGDDFAFRTQFSSQSDNEIPANPAYYYFFWNLLIALKFFKRHGAMVITPPCPFSCPLHFKYSFILWVDVSCAM